MRALKQVDVLTITSANLNEAETPHEPLEKREEPGVPARQEKRHLGVLSQGPLPMLESPGVQVVCIREGVEMC